MKHARPVVSLRLLDGLEPIRWRFLPKFRLAEQIVYKDIELGLRRITLLCLLQYLFNS